MCRTLIPHQHRVTRRTAAGGVSLDRRDAAATDRAASFAGSRHGYGPLHPGPRRPWRVPTGGSPCLRRHPTDDDTPGGMLIHGAIIARELGIPCVNGVRKAADVLQNGDLVTVDGHLGIVTIGAAEFDLELRAESA